MGPDALVRRIGRAGGPQLTFLGEVPFGAPDAALRVRRYRFGNGLRVATLVDRSAPVVSYQSWVGVGSRHEQPGKTGLAHFLEHLMFNETAHVPRGEFDRRLEEVGAENNAATWTDWTVFHETLPAGRLGLAVELEADRLTHLVFEKERVFAEREVVLSERRESVEDDVDGRASEELWRLALAPHPYAHPTLGFGRDIRHLEVADCRRFYRRWYAPNHLVLTVVGDFDEAAGLSAIAAAYGGLPRVRKRATPAEVPRPQRRERRRELRLPCAGERVLLGYRAPAMGDPDWLALTLLGEVLFGGRAAPIYRDLVLEAELATSAWCSLPPFALPSLFEIGLSLREGLRAEDALARLDGHLDQALREPVDDAALARTKARLELAMLSGLESVHGKADQIGFDETLFGAPARVFERLSAYRSLGAEALRQAARRYLRPSQRSVVLVRPSA